jgi:hypothetical protein
MDLEQKFKFIQNESDKEIQNKKSGAGANAQTVARLLVFS